MRNALHNERATGVPVFVVGGRTTAGGYIPQLIEPSTVTISSPAPPIYSTLERTSLLTSATAARGRYVDLARDSDRRIASTIVDLARRQAGPKNAEMSFRDLYWNFLLAAAAFLCGSVVWLRDRGELWLQTAGAAIGLLAFWHYLR